MARGGARMMRSGSLFSGAGALDLAVHEVFGAAPVWFVENDSAAIEALAHLWPGVPNLGDITTVEWSEVEPVHIITGGFPCTDVSTAGKRGGLRPGTRSGLWSQMAYAIEVLHPELVVIENVRGLLSADAVSGLEPCPWCLGDNEGRPLRALGAVLGDLADLGYDARWCGLRASDVGAAHGRFRVFITAWAATQDPHCATRRERRPAGSGEAPRGWPRANVGRRSNSPSPAPADTYGEGRGPGSGMGGSAGEAPERNGAPTAPDPRDELLAEQPAAVAGTATSGQRRGPGANRGPRDRGKGTN